MGFDSEIYDEMRYELNMAREAGFNKGFMKQGNGYYYQNNRTDPRKNKIEEILTCSEYRTLLDVTYMSSKEEIEKYIKTIQKLIDANCFDDVVTEFPFQACPIYHNNIYRPVNTSEGEIIPTIPDNDTTDCEMKNKKSEDSETSDTATFTMDVGMKINYIDEYINEIMSRDVKELRVYTGTAKGKHIHHLGAFMKDKYPDFELVSNWYDQELFIFEKKKE